MQHDELRDTLAIEITRELFRHSAILRPSKDDLADVYPMVDAVLAGRNLSSHITADIRIISEEVKSSLENKPDFAEWCPLEEVHD